MVKTIEAGRNVLWIDGEDTPARIKSRLDTLATTTYRGAGFHWIRSDAWAGHAEIEDRRAVIDWLHDGLMVVDSASSTGAGQTDESYDAWERLYHIRDMVQGSGGER